MTNSVNYKNVIGKTILISFISVLVALGIFVTIMFCAFTRVTANFIYDLGLDRWASQLFYNVYEKDGDISSCYKALSISIRIDDSDRVIKYYKTLISDEDYADFISDVEGANKNLNVGVLEKSRLLNEKDYLRDNYISAMKKTGKIEDAFQLSLGDFKNERGEDLENIGLYSLNIFADGNGLNRFNNTYEGFDSRLVDVMQEYFDNLILEFDSKKGIVESNVEKAYLIALADRIMIVGQDINAVYNFNESNSELVSSNFSRMTAVNEIVKGLI